VNGDGPRFIESIAVALGLAVGLAAFGLELMDKPTSAARLAAVGLVLFILVLVAVWHWGFREGRKRS
jgi:hypothetical protein